MFIPIVQADSSITKSTPAAKVEYRSATLPSKRKAIMQMDFSDDPSFAKMTPQYGEAPAAVADDSNVDQVKHIEREITE